MDLRNQTCNPVRLAAVGALAVVPLLEVLLNGFVAIAAIRSRKRLESNYVSINVASFLSANILYGLLAAYSLLNKAYGFEHGSAAVNESIYTIDNARAEHVLLKLWWMFRNALQICAFLIMSANVSALIYSLRRSSYFVGPAGVSIGNNEHGNCFSSKVKKYSAAAITFATWFGPLILSIASTAHWNCVDLCVCFDGYYKDRFICQADKHPECNRVSETMSNSFIQTVIAVWFLLIVLMMAMVASTFRKFRLVASTPSNSATTSHNPDREGTTQSTGDGASLEREGKQTFKSAIVVSPNSTDETLKVEAERTEWKSIYVQRLTFQRPPKFSRLSYNIRSMILIVILFIVCTAPVITMIFINAVTPEYAIDFGYFMVFVALVPVYGIASPLVLVYYMYGLRYAVISLLQTVLCRSTTVAERRGVTKSRR